MGGTMACTYTRHAFDRMNERGIRRADVEAVLQRGDVIEEHAEAVMIDCVICRRGSRQPGMVTHTIRRGVTIVVVKDIPADVCDVCGEAYFSVEVVDALERLVDDAVRKGAEVEILRYAA